MLNTFTEWLFKHAFSSKLAEVNSVLDQAKKIRPVERYLTIDAFDQDGEFYIGKLASLAEDKILRFWLIASKDKYLKALAVSGSDPKSIFNERIQNQFIGRITAIEELLSDLSSAHGSYMEILEAKQAAANIESTDGKKV